MPIRQTMLGLIVSLGVTVTHPAGAQVEQYNVCWGQDEKQCTDCSVTPTRRSSPVRRRGTRATIPSRLPDLVPEAQPDRSLRDFHPVWEGATSAATSGPMCIATEAAS